MVELLTFIFSVSAFLGALYLARFFARRWRDDILFKAFMVFFLLLALALSWLLLTDISTIFFDAPHFARSRYRPFIFRGLFALAIWQLIYGIRRGRHGS